MKNPLEELIEKEEAIVMARIIELLPPRYFVCFCNRTQIVPHHPKSRKQLAIQCGVSVQRIAGVEQQALVRIQAQWKSFRALEDISELDKSDLFRVPAKG